MSINYNQGRNAERWKTETDQRSKLVVGAQISLPYPTLDADVDDDDLIPPPFLLRLEGNHVLQGLREAVDCGFVDGGLPSWIGEVAKEGRNALQVGERGVEW